jgi:excisionase family DNA binding protein
VSAALLRITPATAAHLAVAVRRHREVLAKLEREIPDALEDLEWAFAEIANRSNGQYGSETVTRLPVSENDAMRPDWLSPREVAATLGVSEATIKRHIASGKLRSSKVGRSRRIHRDAITRFVEAAA